MSELPRAAAIVIIGAGAIGCSIAYHLARRGVRDVVVLDRGAIGAGTSSKGAGGMRSQFTLESEIRFSQLSIPFLQRFSEEFGVDIGYKQTGYLYLLTTPAQFETRKKAIAFQQSHGVDVRLIAPDDIRQIVPDVSIDGVLAAAWGPTDGLAKPTVVVQAYADRARELGVRFFENTAVTSLEIKHGRVTAVGTDAGTISPGTVIDAAGPQAAMIGRMVGFDLPVYPRKRHIFVTESIPTLHHPLPLVTDLGSGFYARSEGDTIIMSPGDATDVPDPLQPPDVDWSLQSDLLKEAARRIPALAHARIATAWSGYRPVTPDDHAIIDRLPRLENALCAIGFCGHGFQHSPATGQMVAELLIDGRTSIDITPFRLGRFGNGEVPGTA